MKITIIAVGKIKKRYLKDGIKDYILRIKPYSSVNIIEVNDEQAPEGIGQKLLQEIKDREGERILKRLDTRSHIISLDVKGASMSSKEFADYIDKLTISGKSHITFIIGGSVGLSRDILKTSNLVLSFSKMTFPHQLMRIILLEQIYRAFKIIRGEPYHK
ncbi:Ribosomal RNA large subunit methyltransferase H [Koleobacter methoxysyntrophicus]|uniref:Ribosomal RNA large subunit methyltransferase H n=1 Tax=Koleobacter methoxysyntrophicus TaxID=2751313 RepID=A0A8A0RK38_9FIRM|nr:23S rRNA (pseudouridine(1915)-N(3))-methyltransferase RlmH [Koleobacter methoxysyntrophicus]QSQ08715.1 Ribosomal RNA large subunit methyltransferase H [Koleobacter methoxysyntrophicus]